jgi:predicted CoA-binding protein
VQSPSDHELRDLFAGTRKIAVLGANTDPGKPACYVPDYLAAQGFEIYPVNPGFVGRTLWGRPCVASLRDITDPIDLVDVFRRPAALMAHVPEILGMTPLPPVVWLQLGISHAEFARTLRDAGIRVIQDRCTLAEHRRLTGG